MAFFTKLNGYDVQDKTSIRAIVLNDGSDGYLLSNSHNLVNNDRDFPFICLVANVLIGSGTEENLYKRVILTRTGYDASYGNGQTYKGTVDGYDITFQYVVGNLPGILAYSVSGKYHNVENEVDCYIGELIGIYYGDVVRCKE